MSISVLWILMGAAIVAAIVHAAVRGIIRSERTRRETLRQAIEANQPEVAMGLMRQQWSQTGMAGLVTAGVGIALLAGMVWHPRQLGGLLLCAGMLLCAGVPMSLFGYLQTRSDGRPGALVWVGPAIAGIAAAIAVFGVASRVHFGPMPSGQEVRDFRQKVRRMTGAPPGTQAVTIDGHEAKPCLTGSNYATQSCGTPYHDDLRFETMGAGYLNVYYIPDTDQYLVIGRARVRPSMDIVEDGFISAQKALGRDAERAN